MSIFHIQLNKGKPSVVKGYLASSVANADYKESWKENGASYIHIVTNPNFSPEDQAYYAGYIEGFLTSYLLSWWLTNNSVLCSGSGCDNPDPKETTFALNNLDWCQQQVKDNQDDTWWYQCGLVFRQMQGLTDGYMASNPTDPTDKKKKLSVTWEQMYLNTLAAADMDDMACIACSDDSTCFENCSYVYAPNPNNLHDQNNPKKRKKLTKKQHHPPILSHCSAVVKLTKDKSDLFVGHGTWDDLNTMIKLFRCYNFPFRLNKNSSALVPAPIVTFSGYPGVLVSGDDFYITSQGLALISSEIGPAPNPDIYVNKGYTPTNIRMSALRIIVGLRICTDIPSLANILYIQDSGTGNNDWLVVDYKKFTPGSSLPPNTVWYFGSYPKMIKTYDVTDTINKQGYLGLYNIPMDSDLYNFGGWPGSNATDAIKQGEKSGDWTKQSVLDLYSYDKNPRALIVQAKHDSVATLDDFKELVRYNDYTADCTSCFAAGPGGANPWNAMLSRGDLVDPNTNYPADLAYGNCFGGIDTKVVNSSLVKSLNYWVIMGPVHNDNLPVFKFSDNPDVCSTTDYPISKVVDKWDFPWVKTVWAVPSPPPYVPTKTTTSKTGKVIVFSSLSLLAIISLVVIYLKKGTKWLIGFLIFFIVFFSILQYKLFR
jgi:hypothetical protein